MTVSLDGMEDGVGGRGCMNESGVLGGSMFGTTFFHASTNAASAVAAAGAGASAENARRGAPSAARDSTRCACLNIFPIALVPVTYKTRNRSLNGDQIAQILAHWIDLDESLTISDRNRWRNRKMEKKNRYF